MKKLFDSWRKSLNEGFEDVCNPHAHSVGWIDNNGGLVSLGNLAADTHSEFAKAYLDPDRTYAPKKELIAWQAFKKVHGIAAMEMAFIMSRLHWIRVANAYAYAGPKMNSIPDEEWTKIVSAIARIISECPAGKQPFLYEYPNAGGTAIITELNPKRFITALRSRGKIEPSRIAQFRETQGKENLQELQVMGDREIAEYVMDNWRKSLKSS